MRAEDLFDTQRDFFVSSLGAKLDSETDVDTLSYPGRAYHLSIDNQGLKMRMVMYFHNKMHYQLFVVTEKEHEFNHSSKHFFDSFRLLNE